MAHDDDEAAEFYENPNNLTPVGPAYLVAPRALDHMVPVRFPGALISAVRQLANADGVTVSAWLRQVASQEIARRQNCTHALTWDIRQGHTSSCPCGRMSLTTTAARCGSPDG